MNTVERVKEICRERKIPIMKLEETCNFGNGYIGGLRKGSIPNDKLFIIAKYLGVSMEYLTTGEESENSKDYYSNEETAQIAQELFENSDMRLLFDAAKDVKPEVLRNVTQLLEQMKGTNPDG